MGLCVLHLVDSTLLRAGATAIAVRGLVDALEREGVAGSMVGLTDDDESTPSPSALRELMAKTDVVHVHGWSRTASDWLHRYAHKASKPVVIAPLGRLSEAAYERSRWRDRWRTALIDKPRFRRASVLVAVNDHEERQLQEDFGDCRINLLPYGVVVDEYDRDDVAESAEAPDRIILVLGPMHPIEGLVPLLKGFLELGEDRDGCILVFAGPQPGDWRKMIEAAVRRKGEADAVRFESAADLTTQRRWLARATILVAPALVPRCPVSLLQAASSGVVSLVTSCAAPPGWGDAGLVCRPSQAEIKAGLQKALALSDADRVRLAGRVHDFVRRKLDWVVLVKDYVRLYRGLTVR